MKPVFITLEGPDGVGKSTQMQQLAAWCEAQSIPFISTRQPGGTPGAEAIRQLLVEGEPERWLPFSELLLHMAAKVEHVERVIRPALAANQWVLCDRYMDSFEIYQGDGHGIDRGFIRLLHQTCLAGLVPDVTFVLTMPYEESVARMATRHSHEHRYERMNSAFHQRIHAGFEALPARYPERCVAIDARPTAEEVHQSIIAHIERCLAERVRSS